MPLGANYSVVHELPWQSPYLSSLSPPSRFVFAPILPCPHPSSLGSASSSLPNLRQHMDYFAHPFLFSHHHRNGHHHDRAHYQQNDRSHHFWHLPHHQLVCINP